MEKENNYYDPNAIGINFSPEKVNEVFFKSEKVRKKFQEIMSSKNVELFIKSNLREGLTYEAAERAWSNIVIAYLILNVFEDMCQNIYSSYEENILNNVSFQSVMKIMMSHVFFVDKAIKTLDNVEVKKIIQSDDDVLNAFENMMNSEEIKNRIQLLSSFSNSMNVVAKITDIQNNIMVRCFNDAVSTAMNYQEKSFKEILCDVMNVEAACEHLEKEKEMLFDLILRK